MLERTQEVLDNLISYDKVSTINPLQPPSIEKQDITEYILCQNFSRGMEKVEQSMERYRSKVTDLEERLALSEGDINDLQRAFRKVKPGDPPTEPGSFLGPSETPENIRSYNKEVAEYNNRLQEARRIQDKIDNAVDKHQDMVERYNDAVREAEERLEELAAEALLLIDEDIVAVLDKTTQIATNLSDSDDDITLLEALEICYLDLKIYNAFEEHIEGNAARRTAQDRIREINALSMKLIEKEEVREFFLKLYGYNSLLITDNETLYGEVVASIEGYDQEDLTEMTQSLGSLLKKEFHTDFKYENIIDPGKLQDVVGEMHQTIEALQTHTNKVNDLDGSTQQTVESSVNLHQELQATLETMKANIEERRDVLVSKGNMFSELLIEEVIEDFYHPSLRPSVSELRDDIVNEIGAEHFNTIILEAEDRYSIEKTEATIKEADLLRLQAQRDKMPKYLSQISTQIKDVEADVESAAEVPKNNADQFRSSTVLFYILSCLPVLGFGFTIAINSKIKKFAPAFRSSLEIYYNLGTAIVVKNKTMQTVILIVGAVLGFGGMGILFGAGLGAKIATSLKVSSIVVNLGLPGIVLVCYIISWVILSNAGKRLQSYIVKSEATPQVDNPNDAETE